MKGGLAGHLVSREERSRTGFSALNGTENWSNTSTNWPWNIPDTDYRRITAKLNEEHKGVNHERVQRLWRAEVLKVSLKTHKQRCLGNGENACQRRKPEHTHHVWAIDFLMDTTLSGGRLKFLTVIDEFSRSCLSINSGLHDH